MAATVTHINITVEASVPDETRALLIALGWTPPDKPGEVEPQPEISVYRERAHLVAYLAAKFRGVLAYNDPDEPDWPVIYIGTMSGQMSWHLSPDDLDLFEHVPVVAAHAVEWDGHTTAEKYQRLIELTAYESKP